MDTPIHIPLECISEAMTSRYVHSLRLSILPGILIHIALECIFRIQMCSGANSSRHVGIQILRPLGHLNVCSTIVYLQRKHPQSCEYSEILPDTAVHSHSYCFLRVHLQRKYLMTCGYYKTLWVTPVDSHS